jgi:SAM-dependent methyltransferase
MKNRNIWKPSKYVYRNGKLVASRDQKEVSVSSRLAADLVAGYYDKNLRQYAKGKLLDLGCGNVPLYSAYRDYVMDNICVDWGNTPHKTDHLDFECDLTKDLPFQNEEFNTIILSDVLEHVPEPEHLWKEMSRVLSVDGIILMNVPFFYRLHEQPYDFYRFTEFALQRFVDGSGLKLIQLESIGGTPEIMADILAKHIQYIPLVGQGLANAIQYITGHFVKTSLGERISENTGRGFPFGYFLIAEKAK